MNALASFETAPNWQPIAAIPETLKDGRDMLLWAEEPVVGQWFCGDWQEGAWVGGRWVGSDHRTIRGVSLWRSKVPAVMLELEAAKRVEIAPPVMPLPGRGYRSPFLAEVEEWLARTGVSDRELGKRSSGDPSFVSSLRRGRDPGSKIILRVRVTMSILEALAA